MDGGCRSLSGLRRNNHSNGVTTAQQITSDMPTGRNASRKSRPATRTNSVFLVSYSTRTCSPAASPVG